MKNGLRLIVSVVTPVLVGALAGMATARGVQEWYPSLVKPSFTPLNWVFGPVWTTLYLMMGIALSRLEAGTQRARGAGGDGRLRDPARPQRTVVVALLRHAPAGHRLFRDRAAVGRHPRDDNRLLSPT
jgi:hypothetical protein